jgi:hypothetical protein
MTLLEIPNITDWISAIATAIGAPLALWGFIKLISRDKDREKEIKSLVDLSESQAKSLEQMKNMLLEFQKQTQEFEYQTNLMRESNEIFKEHVNIISISIKQDKEYRQSLIDLESRKRKSEIKPHFIWAGASGQGYSGNCEVRLKNIGQTAYLKDLIVKDTSPVMFYKEFSEDKMINQNQEVKVPGMIRDGSMSVNVVDYEFELQFVDADNNLYKQTVRRFNNGSAFKVENPQEVN